MASDKRTRNDDRQDDLDRTAADLPRVFDPSFTTKPVGEGTGLGLPTVHGIIAAHGGAVAIASRPGRGTRITIYLPIAPESAID